MDYGSVAMSTSQASTGSLLRRPLRPQQSGLSAAISHRSSETRLSNNLSMYNICFLCVIANVIEMSLQKFMLTGMLPGMRPMPSIASHQDGMQSPVPTMQSEYDPVTHPQRSKQKGGRSHHNESDHATTSKINF